MDMVGVKLTREIAGQGAGLFQFAITQIKIFVGKANRQIFTPIIL